MKNPLVSIFVFLVPALVLAWSGTASASSSVPAPGALSLGLGVGVRSFDRAEFLGLAMTSPRQQTELTSGLELSYQMTTHVRGSIQGRLGGSFSDDVSGFYRNDLSNQSFSVRGGLDWFPSLDTPVAIYVGLGYEYGESRIFYSLYGSHDEGARSHYTGASLRSGLSLALASRLRLRSELVVGGYYAHSAQFGAQQRWLSTSAAATMGLDFDVLRGSAE